MTGDKSLLTGLILKHGGYVTYGDNNIGKIIGSGDIGVKGSLTIQNVLLVEGLKHNLLSISQLCDKGLEVTFQPEICLISNKDSRETHLVGKRDKLKNSAYDEETGSLQKLTKTAEEQNEELDTAELDSAEKETDLIDHQINLPLEWRVSRNLSLDNVIGQIHKGVSTRNSLNLLCEHMAFVSQIEPKTVQEALNDRNWISAMQEELNQFIRNDVWSLVPKTSGMNVIGTKWVFRNKMDEPVSYTHLTLPTKRIV